MKYEIETEFGVGDHIIDRSMWRIYRVIQVDVHYYGDSEPVVFYQLENPNDGKKTALGLKTTGYKKLSDGAVKEFLL